MMADSVEGDGSNGGGSGNQERLAVYNEVQAAYAHARAYDHAVMYAHLWAYVSRAVMASGLLALLWSTVILLGGYVQSGVNYRDTSSRVSNLIHLFVSVLSIFERI